MIDEGMPERRAAARLCVSPCTAHRWKSRVARPRASPSAARRLGARSLQPAHCAHHGARPSRPSSGCSPSASATGWGPRLLARPDRRAAFDGARDPQALRPLTRATDAARGVPARRVAVPGRSAAHGHQALPALPAARAPVHSTTSARPSKSRDPQDTQLGYDYPRINTPPCSLADGRHPRSPARRPLVRQAARSGLVRRPRPDRGHMPGVRVCDDPSTAPSCDGAQPALGAHITYLRPANAADRRRDPAHRHPRHAAGTAKSSACTRRWTANGRAASSTATAAPETAP